MSTTADIRHGDKAKDVITGFTGIVVAKTDWLHGCERITLQPQELRDGKTIDDQTFDAGRIKIEKKGVIPVEAKEYDQSLDLGDRVKDQITGLQGIAMARTLWSHADEQITIEPEGLNLDGTTHKLQSFDIGRIEVVEKGVIQVKKKQITTVATKRNTAPGGPQDDRAALARR